MIRRLLSRFWPRPLDRICASWPSLVGADVAVSTAPVDVQGPVLVVRCATVAWAHQLAFLEPEILRGLPRSITHLRYRVAAPRPRETVL